MRKLEGHKVNPVNDTIDILVTDEPGAGGANHDYDIVHKNPDGSSDGLEELLCTINFQNGPIKENGVNGITQEVLIEICIDRLRSFQAGQYACRENAIALTKLEEAKMWLQSRTRERMARGVEGTTQK